MFVVITFSLSATQNISHRFSTFNPRRHQDCNQEKKDKLDNEIIAKPTLPTVKQIVTDHKAN